MAIDVKGKLVAKASNGKGFKVEGQEGWFNASDAVVPYLAKIEKGEDVVVSYEKKGASKSVVKIVKASGSQEASREETTSEFKCSICGAKLKDGKYKTCYTCSKSKASKEPQKETAKSEETEFKCSICGAKLKDDTYSTCYKCSQKIDSATDKQTSIKRGNALNASAAVLANTELVKNAPDVETIAELVKVVANIFFEYLQEE